MINISHEAALKKIAEFEKIKPRGVTPEDVLLKALITHWLQGDLPVALLNADKSRTWCRYLGCEGKPAITFETVPFPPPDNHRFTFIDLFAGIGGFRLALQSQGGRCVFSSEWNPASQKTYFNNFGEYPFGNIRDFTSDDVSDDELGELIPDHDILAAGFPCQPFSHAGVSARMSIGKSHGFKCETQGTLFFDICRIIHCKKPKVLLLENVKNLKRHDGGRTLKTIESSIKNLGYTFTYDVINSFGVVPQRRERCYMVCFREDIVQNFTFPNFPDTPLRLRDILEEDVDDSYTISNRLWEGHINRSARNVARGTGFTAYTADLDKPSNTLVARYGKDGKECLIPQQNKNPRMLTPRECARLQGFPKEFILPDSRTPAYQQFGNSIVVPVVKRIAENIVAQLGI